MKNSKTIGIYLGGQTLTVMLFVMLTLTAVILLSQSLKFLELVINSGASGLMFIWLTLLAMPRFLEIIVPLSLMGAIFFTYNKMYQDHELTSLRALGFSPVTLAKPVYMIAGGTMLFLWLFMFFITPLSLSSMQHLRQVVKAQYSVMLLREGVFNRVGKDITIYIRERAGAQDMRGLFIQDARDKKSPPQIITARRGELVSGEAGQKIIVHDGARHSYDMERKALSQLSFDSYAIEIPEEATPIRQRWREPEERTIIELLQPSPDDLNAAMNKREFLIEIHKRLVSPLLCLAYAGVALVSLLLMPFRRRGMTSRLILAGTLGVVLQGLMLMFASMARDYLPALAGLYVIPVFTILVTLFALQQASRTQ
ncbi:MAG: LptF/LptG family permease [Alphaproteobacteria bacterium]|nr:LptF/LptG family permease [Alphaproteobacteria bacterium]